MKKKGELTKKELTGLLQRLQAEFENYRKRQESEMIKTREIATAGLIQRLLPVIDSFELALKSEGAENLKKGFEMIYAQLFAILEKEGLKEIDQYKTFDPRLHEAIQAVSSKKSKGEILEVFQKGYMYKDRVIRHARVKVAK